ncbi:PaaX family transcriptional regulator [Plantibacter sp. YIM 135249]|uniref:PaaX family transcriptional regulator n=1 Tax=Plantibacter sp. YIM 135249 TaxID=3423918 RepID=UPI003D354300
MTRVPDDLDARPGSTTSLLRTIVGLYLRRLGGWIAAADFVAVMGELGVQPASSRTAIARLKQKRLLLAERHDGVAGYRLNPDAEPMLVAGDRRIFAVTRMTAGDPWRLVSFTIPEEHRAVRHQLRRRLRGIGCGTVAQGLWICPAFLGAEVDEIIAELDVREAVTSFVTADLAVADSLELAVTRWWDLEAIARLHSEFVEEAEALTGGLADGGASATGTHSTSALASYVRGLDRWRPIPYVDPGLPLELLPADWPGRRSAELFDELSDRFAEAAWTHLRELTSRSAVTAGD